VFSAVHLASLLPSFAFFVVSLGCRETWRGLGRFLGEWEGSVFSAVHLASLLPSFAFFVVSLGCRETWRGFLVKEKIATGGVLALLLEI